MQALPQPWVLETWHVLVTLIMILLAFGGVYKFVLEPGIVRRHEAELKMHDLETRQKSILERVSKLESDRWNGSTSA